MSTSFLDKLLNDFVDWAKTISDCRAVLLYGSTARDEGDKYSDHDIEVVVNDSSDYEPYVNWMRDYAPLWVFLRDGGDSRNLWAIMYRGGHKVHLSVTSVDKLQTVIDSGELTIDYRRGYKILLDKDQQVSQLAKVQKPIVEPPSQQEFSECVQNILYGSCHIAKHIKRGNLWTIQWANGIERRFLLQLIEWHTRAFHPESDTWHRGEYMQNWVDSDIWQALHGIVGQFDVNDSWRALFDLFALFRKLGKEIAQQLNYPFPETEIDEISVYLTELNK